MLKTNISPSIITLLTDFGMRDVYVATIEGVIANLNPQLRLIHTSSIPTTLHLQYAATNPEASRLALTTILRRKGRILDFATDTLKTIRQNLTPDNQKLLDELSQTRTQIASLTFTSIGNKTATEYQQELTTLSISTMRF